MESSEKLKLKKGIATRFRQILNYGNETPQSLAAITGRNAAQYYELLRQDKASLPNMDLLYEIQRVFKDVDLNWWLTGEGKMRIKDVAEEKTGARAFRAYINEVDLLINDEMKEQWLIKKQEISRCYQAVVNQGMEMAKDIEKYEELENLKDVMREQLKRLDNMNEKIFTLSHDSQHFLTSDGLEQVISGFVNKQKED